MPSRLVTTTTEYRKGTWYM